MYHVTSVYVNSATFLSNDGMAPNFILRLLMPNYRGWKNQIFKIPLRDCIFKTGVFLSFLKIFREFSQIGFTYLFFAF